MAECLLPQDAVAWILDSGAPDSVCSLFLDLPATSALDRYSFVEYAARLVFVCALDYALMYFWLKLRPMGSALRQSFELNLITHPVVFFFMPILGAHQSFAIGNILLMNVGILLGLKGYFLVRYVKASLWRKAATLTASILLAWYAGALISL